MKVNLSSNQNKSDDAIDLVALIKKIWTDRKLVLRSIILFFFIGCLVALLSPVVYTSQTTFVPQVSGDDFRNNNNLGSLASLAGINLNASDVNSDSYLSPLVYENIINSEEFSLKLINEEIINSNLDKITIGEYLLNESSINFNIVGFIKKYTIGLFVNKQSDEINSELLENYNFISDVDYNLLQKIRGKYAIELNAKEGFVRVLATDKNAFISAQLVQKVTKSLQSKIIEIRTNKIKERLEFSKKQYELKQQEFNILVSKLAEFKDSNKSISTAIFLSELQKLESEYQLQQNILINLASEYNNNKLKLNKNTPIFSVIDEVSVPNLRTEPKRGLLVIIYVFLGLVISVGFVIGKEPVLNLIKEIKN